MSVREDLEIGKQYKPSIFSIADKDTIVEIYQLTMNKVFYSDIIHCEDGECTYEEFERYFDEVNRNEKIKVQKAELLEDGTLVINVNQLDDIKRVCVERWINNDRLQGLDKWKLFI